MTVTLVFQLYLQIISTIVGICCLLCTGRVEPIAMCIQKKPSNIHHWVWVINLNAKILQLTGMVAIATSKPVYILLLSYARLLVCFVFFVLLSLWIPWRSKNLYLMCIHVCTGSVPMHLNGHLKQYVILVRIYDDMYSARKFTTAFVCVPCPLHMLKIKPYDNPSGFGYQPIAYTSS